MANTRVSIDDVKFQKAFEKVRALVQETVDDLNALENRLFDVRDRYHNEDIKAEIDASYNAGIEVGTREAEAKYRHRIDVLELEARHQKALHEQVVSSLEVENYRLQKEREQQEELIRSVISNKAEVIATSRFPNHDQEDEFLDA